MVWRRRDGLFPEQLEYYASANYGPDSNRTFDFSGLVVFTDAKIGVIPTYKGKGKKFCYPLRFLSSYPSMISYTSLLPGGTLKGMTMAEEPPRLPYSDIPYLVVQALPFF